MRKHLIKPCSEDAPGSDHSWLDLDRIAVVEVTSEDKSSLQ